MQVQKTMLRLKCSSLISYVIASVRRSDCSEDKQFQARATSFKKREFKGLIDFLKSRDLPISNSRHVSPLTPSRRTYLEGVRGLTC